MTVMDSSTKASRDSAAPNAVQGQNNAIEANGSIAMLPNQRAKFAMEKTMIAMAKSMKRQALRRD
jgi:hypothetical protein